MIDQDYSASLWKNNAELPGWFVLQAYQLA
jgi:hypothetical protein